MVEPLTFEIQDRVDHVLEHLGAGDRAVLGDMADQEHGRAARLGDLQEAQGALSELGNAAGQAIHVLGHDRLDRVDHRQADAAGADGGDDGVGVGFAQEQQVARAQAHATSAQADLGHRLFA